MAYIRGRENYLLQDDKTFSIRETTILLPEPLLYGCCFQAEGGASAVWFCRQAAGMIKMLWFICERACGQLYRAALPWETVSALMCRPEVMAKDMKQRGCSWLHNSMSALGWTNVLVKDISDWVHSIRIRVVAAYHSPHDFMVDSWLQLCSTVVPLSLFQHCFLSARASENNM